MHGRSLVLLRVPEPSHCGVTAKSTTKLGEKRGKSRLYCVDKHQEYGKRHAFPLLKIETSRERGQSQSRLPWRCHWCHGAIAERPRFLVFLLVPLESGHASIPPTLVKKLSIQATEIEMGTFSYSTYIESKCYNRGAIDRSPPTNIRYPTGKITRRTRMLARGSEELY